MKSNRIAWIISLLGLLLAPAASAIEFDEVRNFEEVFLISGDAPDRHRIEVRWDIEKDYYLYNNKFLRFTSGSDGVVLGEPQVPRGEISFDELLGEEVEKYHDELTVTLPLLSVAPGVEALQLRVRSQGCLENVLCYPPSEQLLLVGLPPAESGNALTGLDGDSVAGLAQADPLLGQADPPALAPEQAFVYESIGLSADTALVRFTAQPGYYLYADKFEFRVSGAEGFEIVEIALPEGVVKDDPEFGPVPVYYGQIEVPVRFKRPAGPAGNITLEADFQGCRDGDICYPPMSRVVTFQMPEADTGTGRSSEKPADIGQPALLAGPPVTEQDKLAGLLTSNPLRAIAAFFSSSCQEIAGTQSN